MNSGLLISEQTPKENGCDYVCEFDMNDFTKLRVWEDSMALSTLIYQHTQTRGFETDFNLRNQIRKCAVSIPSNIAEGATRNSNKEFKRFLNVASSSAAELWTQVEISKNVGCIEEAVAEAIKARIELIRKKIYRLSESIKT